MGLRLRCSRRTFKAATRRPPLPSLPLRHRGCSPAGPAPQPPAPAPWTPPPPPRRRPAAHRPAARRRCRRRWPPAPCRNALAARSGAWVPPPPARSRRAPAGSRTTAGPAHTQFAISLDFPAALRLDSWRSAQAPWVRIRLSLHRAIAAGCLGGRASRWRALGGPFSRATPHRPTTACPIRAAWRRASSALRTGVLGPAPCPAPHPSVRALPASGAHREERLVLRVRVRLYHGRQPEGRLEAVRGAA